MSNMNSSNRLILVFVTTACFALAGCASGPIDRSAATLDACCIDPTPADAKTQKFLTGKVRMQSITFCTTR